jgi:hypothetical protein
MSADRRLPEDVEQFILQQIDSVAELEALLLVRAEPVTWNAKNLAQRLYITDAGADALLHALLHRGFIAREGVVYRYAPSPDHAPLVDAVAATYGRFLIPITNLIHSKSSAALRDFADAFRLRGDK